MASAQKFINSLVSGLPPRQREVILGRFGLDKPGETKTLAAIGDKFGLTRERVRQIEEIGLAVIRKTIKENGAAIRFIGRVERMIVAAGGAIREDSLLVAIPAGAEGLKRNHLIFLGETTGAFSFYPEDNDFSAFYYIDKSSLAKLRDFIYGLASYLERHKKEVLEEKFDECLKEYIRSEGFEKKTAATFLGLSKTVEENRYGMRGLARWPEVVPTTARDRAHLVLHKIKKPMHFAEITEAINNAGLGQQVSLAATVHNELIKDPRFVLVGRGTYALREHGYEPGVAREVIQRVLRKHGPLHPEGVIEHVNKERLFKPNTVIINLQNKNYFERLADGRYRVRES